MKTHDRVALVGLMLAWGFNFTVIRIALVEIPPLLLGALRFTLVALPAVFLLPRPTAPWLHVAAFGVVMFALQFSLLFAGMALGVGAGLASLLLQAQVFVTIGLALVLGAERPSLAQWCGLLLGCAGLGLLALESREHASVAGLSCVLAAALSWGVANTLSRRLLSAQPVLGLVAWGSLFSVPPVAAVSLWREGWTAWCQVFTTAHAQSWWAVAFIAYVSTLGGFALWGWQMRRYPAIQVAPHTMLVPVFGLLFATVLLHERVSAAQWVAAALVLAGVGVASWGRELWRLAASRA